VEAEWSWAEPFFGIAIVTVLPAGIEPEHSATIRPGSGAAGM